MKPSTLFLSLCLSLFTPLHGGIEASDAAPDFTVDAALAQGVQILLAEALKKDRWFSIYPKSFTSVCTVEAHEFAENIENFVEPVRASLASGDKIEVQPTFDQGMPRQISGGATQLFVIKAYDAVQHSGCGRGLCQPISYVFRPRKDSYAYSDSNAEKHIENTLASSGNGEKNTSAEHPSSFRRSFDHWLAISSQHRRRQPVLLRVHA